MSDNKAQDPYGDPADGAKYFDQKANFTASPGTMSLLEFTN